MKHEPIYYYDPEEGEFKKQPMVVINLGQAIMFYTFGWICSALLSTLLFITLVD